MHPFVCPRITASRPPHHASRAKGERGGMADLADSAIAARAGSDGPGACRRAARCLLLHEGLETVARERRRPVRSAKLVLRTALMALSRHYSRPAPAPRPRVECWGAEGYRPELYS
ncbi:DUF6456 domain-containing protein [Rhizobium tibeticum]|uniref:DUF6456 domain-containing protein n=1 Tax=Rhizobium tibeticum TaxID=501024 RepID=UPI0035208158